MTGTNSIGSARRGAFITIEGGEGAGKSTQRRALMAHLAAAGIDTVSTREPGGSSMAERIRAVLLAGRFRTLGPAAEATLFAAARIDHLDATILPALAAGRWIVCDRFHDSTRAYQGQALQPGFLDALERVTLAGACPDLTLILDLPAAMGLARAAARRNGAAQPDRFEGEALGFHERLRRAFLDIAAREPERCVVVDATQTPDEVAESIWDAVRTRLPVPTRATPPGTFAVSAAPDGADVRR